MAVHVFGRRGQGDVGAQVQGALSVGGQERVVDNGAHAAVAGEGAGRSQIGQSQSRVAGGLQQQQVGGCVEGASHGCGVGGVHELRGHAQRPEDLLQQTERAAVQHFRRHDPASGFQQGEAQGRDGAQAGAEGHRRWCPFELSEAGLEDRHGRIADAAIGESLLPAHAGVAEGGGLVDRGQQSPVGGIGIGTAVDAQGRKRTIVRHGETPRVKAHVMTRKNRLAQAGRWCFPQDVRGVRSGHLARTHHSPARASPWPWTCASGVPDGSWLWFDRAARWSPGSMGSSLTSLESRLRIPTRQPGDEELAPGDLRRDPVWVILGGQNYTNWCIIVKTR